MIGLIERIYLDQLDMDNLKQIDTQEYREKFEEFIELENLLITQLNDEAKIIYENLSLCQIDIMTLEKTHEFSYGFKVGMLVMMETQNYSKKYLDRLNNV